MQPPIPFHNMAISLSGGGYRATAYHLGALSFLDALEFGEHSLLKNVKIVSTISGGTLTGIMYTLKLAEGGSFSDCFDKIYTLLSEDKLVDHALDKLNNPGKWKNKFKSRDLINAFAEVYNEDFYDEATFAKFYEAKKMHLTDAIFGSSEFTYGIQFRFQKNKDNGKFGNYYLNFPDEVAKEIRLADAAAASSCFPGGFEPMVMPKDFGNGPESNVNKTWYASSSGDTPYPTTGLMDGGVIDNQGIEGVKLVEERRGTRAKPYIGTYIISDVSSRMMAPYEVPAFENNSFKNFFTLNRINFITAGIFVVLVGIIFYETPPIWGIVLASAIMTIIAIWIIIFLTIKSVFVKTVCSTFSGNEVPEILKDLKVLLKTPVYILIYLLKFRVTSVLKMITDVFMRRIRRLQLSSLFDSDEWKYRVLTNDIYTLENEEIPPLLKPIVKAANSMPTTLWFSEKEKQVQMLDKLIACGQFNLCFNLMEYSKDRKKREFYGKNIWNELSEDEREKLDALHDSIIASWKKFKEDPYWLIKENKAKDKSEI